MQGKDISDESLPDDSGDGLAVNGHLVQGLLIVLLQFIGERGVVERVGGGLAFADDVLDESLESLALVLVGTVLGDDEEGEGGDRVGVRRGSRCVHDGTARIFAELAGEC